MKKELLVVIGHAKTIIAEQQARIENARKWMLENSKFAVGEKVTVIDFGWNPNATGKTKEAFISRIGCDEKLEYFYDFLAVKKDGTPSKQSAGIWGSNVEVEKLK